MTDNTPDSASGPQDDAQGTDNGEHTGQPPTPQRTTVETDGNSTSNQPDNQAANQSSKVENTTGHVMDDLMAAVNALGDKISETPEKMVDALREATTIKPEQQQSTPDPEPAKPEKSSFAKFWFGDN